MGNKKLQIVKQGENSKMVFSKEKIITNQLFARLKQKSEMFFIRENLKNWKFKLRRA